MQMTPVQTRFGPIPLWSPPGALASAGPVVLAITGAWAEPDDMMKTPAVVAPAWDAAVMRLPGNGTPMLAETSIAAWAKAVGELVETAFAGRPVVLAGLSVGALVALGVRNAQVRRVVAVEPPLVMRKLWPMAQALRARWRDDSGAREFIEAVFGLTGDAQADRTYFELFDGAPPADVIVGETPLYPERPLPRFPSFVDESERAWLAAQPGVSLQVAAGAGHNIHVFAGERLRQVLLAGLDKALAGAEP
ncbi:MAG TPA: alpha/beta hydrolase [Phenylobacterium sp.]|jgi:pimeloyl-ACP methyl ester carboxylesterase|uniref:alpha/beta fold hydrolase n=1 Tax=Phenylobacterium sp. TaxID=1871053 RepID=UPI002D72F437|nr:alpha/beta hydrolase [Phenylobacterium sp.]HZZ67576.1 alpha/beta hydrolase [Phenylobacterium sp.]